VANRPMAHSFSHLVKILLPGCVCAAVNCVAVFIQSGSRSGRVDTVDPDVVLDHFIRQALGKHHQAALVTFVDRLIVERLLGADGRGLLIITPPAHRATRPPYTIGANQPARQSERPRPFPGAGPIRITPFFLSDAISFFFLVMSFIECLLLPVARIV